MQQRVQIAKALSNNPPILLLDEVTTGLDLSVQAAVLDLIQQIRRDFNVSMLVVSHDLGVIRMLADRTLVMLDGRVIESGLTDQILEDPQHAHTPNSSSTPCSDEQGVRRRCAGSSGVRSWRSKPSSRTKVRFLGLSRQSLAPEEPSLTYYANM